MNKRRQTLLIFCSLSLLFLFAACAPLAPVSPAPKQKTVTISKTFQAQASPVPTFPPYVCAAWSSNNAPGPNSTISIYAKITKHIAGVSGAVATATVHFQYQDVTLDQQPVSDSGGFVTFTLPLEGRQPVGVPATVDVTFSNIPGHPGPLQCTPAFFTPQ